MSHNKYEFISELYKNILESKYCLELTDSNKNIVYKETFQNAIYRVAHEVNKYDKHKFDVMKQKTIQFISNKDFSPAGGIWRAAGNPSTKVSFVNCTTQPPVKDSIENIFGDSLMNWSRIASYGQGNGIDISGLRPRGAKTNNCAKYSTGAVSFLINYDASMQVIGAENRRGATKPDLWIYHPDSEEFISCKSDITKLTSQNISVKIDSHFMQCVEKNKNIELKWKRINNEVFIGETLFDNDSPGPNLEITKQINARNLFQKIAFQAWKTGEPGIEFWDFSEYWSNSNYHPNKKFHIVSTNGCSEQKLDPYNTCVLASINFYNMPLYHENWKDWLIERVSFGIRFLDNVMLAEYEENRSPHPIQKQKLKEMTRIGLGFTGLYDWFIKNKIIYGSEKSIELINKIMSIFAESAYRTSIELGKERGSFTEFQKEWFTQSPFIKRLCELTNLKLNDFEFMRHVCCLSVAPTGTLSMVVGTGGNGCEPSFSPYYERKERAVTGEYRTHVIYDNCVLNELKRKKLKVTKKNIDEMIQSEEWVFAAWNKNPKKNIHPIDKIKLMSELYKYIDSGISVTYNLSEFATIEDILEIYYKSWEYKLKSVTVYRDKSREGVLNHITDKSNNKNLSKLVSFKRPQEVICDIHQTNVSGQKWIVLIGLIEDIPYEVFCGLSHKNFNPSIYPKGKIFKNEKGNYFLILKNKAKEVKLDIKKSFKNDGSESAMTRLVSLNLRHRVDIKFIVQQLVKAEGDMTTFAKAISRVLKKYIEDGSKLVGENCPNCQKDSLIHQSNCIVCNECGWSRC
ncbi:hypothetical protein [Silvanigrella sp.]|jgi:ribonucleoside-diphosphate reductase alpha chain|uniref:TSCPD domain-containing protein n=1 Tax=Silvanigrella sp. TaxID=2024976 RepID=UPI0037CBCC1B|nr:hypothetical protein [Silvanigrellaceae bacterium]